MSTSWNQNKDLTTLVIKKSTRQALKHLARKDQTYDQLLIELMNQDLNKKSLGHQQTQQQQTQETNHRAKSQSYKEFES